MTPDSWVVFGLYEKHKWNKSLFLNSVVVMELNEFATNSSCLLQSLGVWQSRMTPVAEKTIGHHRHLVFIPAHDIKTEKTRSFAIDSFIVLT